MPHRPIVTTGVPIDCITAEAPDSPLFGTELSPDALRRAGLPPRHYLPLTEVRMDLLLPSDTQSHCPYKGTASYWSVQAGGEPHRDIVWIYRTPLPESQKIAGLACFYDEKVDVYLDGELQPRPKTHFS